MKFNRYFIMAVVAISGFTAGCSNEDPAANVYNNVVYIQTTTPVSTFFIKPSLIDNSQSIFAGMARPIEAEVSMTFKAAPELVEHYNQAYYDKAIVLPAEHYEIPDSKAIIPAGAVKSSPVLVNFKSVAQLDREKIYVLPVTLAESSQVDMIDSKRTVYYVFRGAALINTVADIEKNYLSIDWKNPGVCNNLEALTMEALVRARYFTRPGSDVEILSLMGDENTFLIRMGDSNYPGQLQISTSSGSFPGKNSNYVLPLNQWVHIAVTYDSSKPSNRLQIYINGALQVEGDTGSGFRQKVSLGSSGFYIGRSWNDNRWWAGEMAECRIWNRALSAEEIGAKDHFYSVDPASNGLVAYWKFDEGDGELVKDYTANGNNAQAHSALKWTSVSLPAK